MNKANAMIQELPEYIIQEMKALARAAVINSNIHNDKTTPGDNLFVNLLNARISANIFLGEKYPMHSKKIAEIFPFVLEEKYKTQEASF